MWERIKRLPLAVKLAVPISAAVAVGAVSVLAIGGAGAANDADTVAQAPVTRSVASAPLATDAQPLDFARGDRDGRVPFRGPLHGGERGERGDFQAIADLIGIDVDALKTELEGGSTLAEIAVANGSTAQAVIDHLTTRITERLDQAVAKIDEAEADGKITAERAATARARFDEVRANAGEMAAEMVNEGFDRHDGDRMLLGDLEERLDAVGDQLAALLGIDEDQLETDLKAGKSLADIATANGVEPHAVIDLITSEAETMIDEVLAEGEIDQAEADEIRTELLPLIGTFVNEGFRGLARELRGAFGDWDGGFGRDGHGWGEHRGKGHRGDWADRDPRGGRSFDRDWRGSGIGQMAELTAIAEAVGTDAAGLMTAIADGQSLADIARSNDADPQVVTDLLISQFNERVDAAVESGKLSADKAAEMKTEFAASAADIVEATMDDVRRHFGKRGHNDDTGSDEDEAVES